MKMGGGWVIDLDIQGFFDTLDHRHLRGFLDRRVRDGVLRRAIDKWLKARVLEDGRLRRSTLGTPQGGVVSPLLANIYLHHVLDAWFTTEVPPRLRGRSVLVLYADAVAIVIEEESDARRVLDVPPNRLARFGLDQGAFVGDRNLVIVGMDFIEGQEAMTVPAVIDKGGLQRGFNTRYFR